MKKTGIIMGIASVLAVALTGCGGGEQTYRGEYTYNTEYGVYGMIVDVTVKGDTIKKVEIVPGNYQSVTEEWEGSKVYHAGEQSLVESFSGKKISEVKSYSVEKREDGVPVAVKADGLLLVTGASQSSGRMVLAVQNAIAKV